MPLRVDGKHLVLQVSGMHRQGKEGRTREEDEGSMIPFSR